MFDVPNSQPTRAFTAVDQRRKELDLLRWRDLADQAGLSEDTIRAICDRTTAPSTRQIVAERKLETALGWAHGSIQAVRDGGDPTMATAAPSDPAERAIMEDPDLSDESRRLLIDTLRAFRKKGP